MHKQVVPISPPAGAVAGELVTFAGFENAPLEAGNKASKIFSKICDDFYVDDQMRATFQGTPFMTSAGEITSTLKGSIS